MNVQVNQERGTNRERNMASDAEIVSDADVDSKKEATASEREMAGQAERLDPLFAPPVADDYRTRWGSVQGSFVDDPRKAVEQGDELVCQVLKNLSDSFDAERERLRTELSRTGEASTETLRLTLRRYRSLFERLLSV
jgi:hypothetical protein